MPLAPGLRNLKRRRQVSETERTLLKQKNAAARMGPCGDKAPRAVNVSRAGCQYFIVSICQVTTPARPPLSECRDQISLFQGLTTPGPGADSAGAGGRIAPQMGSWKAEVYRCHCLISPWIRSMGQFQALTVLTPDGTSLVALGGR